MKHSRAIVLIGAAAASVLLLLGAATVQGSLDWRQFKAASRHGTQNQGQASDGTGATGHLATYNADGSLTDGGAAGGSNAPIWFSVTDPNSTTFVWRNQGSATVTAQAANHSIYLSAPANNTGFSGREISAPAAPVSITVAIIPQLFNVATNICGLYVTDGTKMVAITIADTGGNIANSLETQKYSSFNSGTFSNNYANPGMGYFISPLFLKVVDDNTNLKWYWSPDGVDFQLISSAARLDFLASISAIGVFVGPLNASWSSSLLLVSWTQGTS